MEILLIKKQLLFLNSILNAVYSTLTIGTFSNFFENFITDIQTFTINEINISEMVIENLTKADNDTLKYSLVFKALKDYEL